MGSQIAMPGIEGKTALSARPNAYTDLDVKYHRITFGDAVSSQAKRDAAATVLNDIHNTIVARKKN